MPNTSKVVEIDQVKQELMRLLGHMEYQYCESRSITRENVVTYLMQNGVTVQEWISVKDRLPKPGERVLVSIGAVFEAFIDDAGKWQRYYSAPLDEVLGTPTHWMPLPQPPKGE